MDKKRTITALLTVNLLSFIVCLTAIGALYLYTRRRYKQLDDVIFEGRFYATTHTDWTQVIPDQPYDYGDIDYES